VEEGVTTEEVEGICQGGFLGRTKTKLVNLLSPVSCSGTGKQNLSSTQIADQHVVELFAPIWKRAALQAGAEQQVWTQASKVMALRSTVKLTRVVLPVPMGTEEGNTLSRKSGQEDGDVRENGGFTTF